MNGQGLKQAVTLLADAVKRVRVLLPAKTLSVE
jgi:hypothetical protein